jgi:glycine/D-amino acid oxidase-like deaminating enzyme
MRFAWLMIFYITIIKGLQIFDKTDIIKFDYKKNGVMATTDYGNTIKAKKVIFCNGFESTEIIKDKFVNLLLHMRLLANNTRKTIRN